MKSGFEAAWRVQAGALDCPKAVADSVEKLVGHCVRVRELEKLEHQVQPLLQAVVADKIYTYMVTD